PCPPGRLARRDLDADLLDRSGRALSWILQARLVSRRRTARSGGDTAAEQNRPVLDRCSAGRSLGTVRTGAPPPRAPRTRARGVPAIAGVILFVAVVYITVNFIVDVLYGVIDPRIRVR